MSVRDDSRKILQHFLTKAIECGDLRQEFRFQYADLATTLNLHSSGYCRVCCQYLKDCSCIKLSSCASEKDPDSKDMEISLSARAIDFLEMA